MSNESDTKNKIDEIYVFSEHDILESIFELSLLNYEALKLKLEVTKCQA